MRKKNRAGDFVNWAGLWALAGTLGYVLWTIRSTPTGLCLTEQQAASVDILKYLSIFVILGALVIGVFMLYRALSE